MKKDIQTTFNNDDLEDLIDDCTIEHQEEVVTDANEN